MENLREMIKKQEEKNNYDNMTALSEEEIINNMNMYAALLAITKREIYYNRKINKTMRKIIFFENAIYTVLNRITEVNESLLDMLNVCLMESTIDTTLWKKISKQYKKIYKDPIGRYDELADIYLCVVLLRQAYEERNEFLEQEMKISEIINRGLNVLMPKYYDDEDYSLRKDKIETKIKEITEKK